MKHINSNHRQGGSMLAVIVMFALLATTGPVSAQVTSFWNSAVNGGWEDTSKWNAGVPGTVSAGTNAFLGGSTSYSVTYSNPLSVAIGGLYVTNATGQTTTLNINTNGFKFSQAASYLQNATLNINTGGVVTNTQAFCGFSVNNALVTLNGGTYVQTAANFGNSSAGATSVALQMNSGTFVFSGGGNFFTGVTMTGGALSVTNVYLQMYTSTFSGGVFSNNGPLTLGIRAGTITVTNQGQVVTTGISLAGNSEVLRIDGGTLTITGGTFVDGTTAGGTRHGLIVQTAGTVTMTNVAGLVLGTTYNTAGGDNQYQLKGGTLNLEKITLGSPGDTGGNNNVLNVSGGTLNLGSGGIITNLPSGGTATYQVLLSGGTLAAKADWSSTLNMVLTNNPGPGTVTFQAADANSVAHDITLTGGLKGNGALVKTGAGNLILGGVNTYSGATTISNGTLLVNGSLAAASAVAAIGGTLGGTGTVNGAVSISGTGTLSPGNSIGTLTVGALTLSPGAQLNFELGATNASDLVIANGTLALGGLQFNQFTWTTNAGFGQGTYTLIDATGLSGSLGSLTNGVIGGLSASLWTDNTGNNLMLTVIPEPSALLLAVMGLFGGGLMLKVSRRKSVVKGRSGRAVNEFGS